VEEQLHRLRQALILHWEEMRLKLQEKYLPMDYEESLFEELLSHRQGNMTIDEYTHRFHELTTRSQVNETEHQSIARYKTGLRDDIRRELLTVRLVSVDEAYQLALRIEQQSKAFAARRGTTGWVSNASRFTQNSTIQSNTNNTTEKPIMRSNDRNFQDRDDRRGKSAMGVKLDKGREECYRYGGRGHYPVVCPTREQKPALFCNEELDLAEQEAPQEQPISKHTELPEEQLEGSDLPLCVIRRMLTGQRLEDPDKDDWLRTNIFHTRVEHKGKALNLIIDSGSGMNVISQEAVTKLKCPVERHPKPYKVSWVDDTSIPVKHRCLISFSLGKRYRDSVWCDVIPMKACHILLGRPWLYDRRVSYDGYSNTYSFSFDGHKIILQPLKIDEFEGNKPTESRVLTLQKFTTACKETGVVLLLISRTVPVEAERPVPQEVKRLLAEFVDLVPDELPKILPPMRNIQHAIDLVPGSVLPNLPAYRMSPEEHKELQRQVQDLLDRGFIRESLSPCAVPALLTPKKDGS